MGNTANDTVSVDQMFIKAVTLGGTTGSELTLPSSPGSAKAIDFGDQDSDGYADLAVGTSSGKIYRLFGSPGGLLLPGSAFCATPTCPALSVSGIKWINGTAASRGLEIAFSADVNAYVITGDRNATSAGAVSGALAAPGSITAFGSGDIDGDGDDDLMIATVGGAIRYWRNLGGATSWDRSPNGIDLETPPLNVQIYDLDLGDMSNSAYRGR